MPDGPVLAVRIGMLMLTLSVRLPESEFMRIVSTFLTYTKCFLKALVKESYYSGVFFILKKLLDLGLKISLVIYSG